MDPFVLQSINGIEDLIIEEKGDLSKHTGFRTGGTAILAYPQNISALSELLLFVRRHDIRHHILGNGTNTLALDEGYDGIVILTKQCANELKVEGEFIRAGAGLLLIDACRAALNNNLTGLEFAYGIPGSVGGAVYMNAGAYDGEIKDVLYSVDYLDENDQLRTAYADQLCLDYRTSVFHDRKDWIILSALFKLSDGDHFEIKNKMEDLMGRRKEKQPLEFPSCGSTFKRPLGNYASKLIDECGLKGCSVGGAQVSEKHCGFIINRSHATSKDILELIDIVRSTVLDKTGYKLECEIEILN